MKQILFFAKAVVIILLMSAHSVISAQVGKNGAVTITAANTVVNAYTALTATATAGSTSVSATISNLNNGTALSAGDLLLIIGMQGATMETTNNASYGNVTALNSAGAYEYAWVCSVSGTNTIVLQDPLTNTFTVGGTSRVQVVRVPLYSSLTVNTGASISATPWNGTTGGIIAIHSAGEVTLNGTISANAAGFRGGIIDNSTSTANASVVADFVSNSSSLGAEKGESIVGFGVDYDALGGRYCRGAAANSGGGGNGHNAGGGGGSNGFNGVLWNGLGNPDVSGGAGWISAWNLESANFANNTSSGGGRGGYTYGSSNQDATVLAPGSAAWGGDQRDNVGGQGGRPMSINAENRIFFGGGGGAGDGNNNANSPGGAGGGIIYIIASSVSGSGTISANGATAANTNGGHNDAPGGGGGGGTVIIKSTVANTITISANGGKGGDQLITSNESEGAGGGGGGGYIAITSGTPTISVNGGANGVSNSAAVTEFTPNGATRGGTGQTGSVSSNITTYNPVIAALSPSGPYNICVGGTIAITASGGNSYLWSTGGTGATESLNAANNYNVTVTRHSGCSAVANLTVGNSAQPSFTSVSVINPTCAGGASSGSVVMNGVSDADSVAYNSGLTFSSGTFVRISELATPNTLTGLSSGDYVFRVKNTSGCFVEQTTSLTDPLSCSPIAQNDILSAVSGYGATGNVATNDSDPENLALTYSLLSGPANGSVTFNSNGTFIYTSNSGYTGTDIITYQVCNTASYCSTATITVNVSAFSCSNQWFCEVAGLLGVNMSGTKEGGFCWADFNEDGFLDVQVNSSDVSVKNQLYFSNNGTSFTNVTATNAAGLDDINKDRSAVSGDFNNDGYMDFMVNAFNRIEVWLNNGPSSTPAYSFGNASQQPSHVISAITGGINAEGIVLLDYDNDGDLDFIVDNQTFGVDIMSNDGTGNFTHVNNASTGLPAAGTSGDYAAAADFDNDGYVDVCIRRTTESDIYRNNGNGTFTANGFNEAASNGNKGGVCWADFDNDGDLDLFWADNSVNQIWRNDNGSFIATGEPGASSGTVAALNAASIDGCTAADVDNDGDIDLFIGNIHTDSYLFINENPDALTFSRPNAPINRNISPGGNVQGTSFVDYNNDGQMDLYVAMASGANQLWENQLTNNDYLRVKAEWSHGAGSSTADGATAALFDCSNNRISPLMNLASGEGYGTYGNPVFHFGVPIPNETVWVRVYFPFKNGVRKIVTKQVIPSSLPNQELTILDTDASDTQACANTAPVAVNDSFTIGEDATLNDSVATNDSDPENDVLSYTVVSNVTNGTLTLNTDGTFEYTPSANYYGNDGFTYEVCDPFSECATATVTINVTPINDAPVADDDIYTGDEDQDITDNVNSNDSDIENDVLTYTLVSGPSNGTLNFNNDGSFTYTPNADFNGTDSFTYNVCDGEPLCDMMRS